MNIYDYLMIVPAIILLIGIALYICYSNGIIQGLTMIIIVLLFWIWIAYFSNKSDTYKRKNEKEKN